jgi:hypothetical protein
MADNKDALTVDRAIAILAGMALVEKAGQPYEDIAVSNVSYEDADGQPFKWSEDSDRTYAIVNLKATNQFLLDRAIEKLSAGDDLSEEEIQEALSCNLSLRMDVADAKKLGKGTIGTLTARIGQARINPEDENSDTVDAILASTFVPTAAIAAKRTSVEDIKAKMAAKAAGAGKIDEDNNPVVGAGTGRGNRRAGAGK